MYYSADYVTGKYIEAFLSQDFSFTPTAPLPTMCSGDRVKVDMKMLDYLRDFFKIVYHGQKIPKVFDKLLIETDAPEFNTIMRLYVSFPENTPGWVIVDIFFGWSYVGKVFHLNEDFPDSCRDPETGLYHLFNPSMFVNKEPYTNTDLQKLLVSLARDLFEYVYLFIHHNQEDPSIFKEEEIPVPGKKKHTHKKKSHRTTNNLEGRKVVHVPRRRIYSLTAKTTAHIPIPRPPTTDPNYRVANWKVKGHTRRITKKDGTVMLIPVKPHSRSRKKALAPGASGTTPGTDYILHQRPLK